MNNITIEHVNVNDIKEYGNNPRLNDDSVDKVAKSISEYGFVVPMVVDDNNIIVTGHTRFKAAKQLSMSEIPCIRASHLTDNQVNAFRVADNKLSELSDWDIDKLTTEITTLMDVGVDIIDLGFSQSEIDCLYDMVDDDCLSAAPIIESEYNDPNAMANKTLSSDESITVISVGDVRFYTKKSDYHQWLSNLNKKNEYSVKANILDVANLLGITPILSDD